MVSPQRTSPSSTVSRPLHEGRSVHRVVFVTGKGGVGKSAVAAATALQLARQGRRVLLVELGSRSFYGPLLGLKVGSEAVPWRPGVEVARWDVESSLRQYLGHYLLFKPAADTVLNNTVMKALVAAAPSLAEIVLLGRLMAPMRTSWLKRDVDAVVVDAYATGQFMAFLRAPRGIAQTASSGPMHAHTAAMAKLLADASICEYRLVTLAEELPVAEACEMAAELVAETGVAPRVYCNRLLELPPLPPPLPPDDPAAAFVAAMARTARRQHESLAALEALGSRRSGPVARLPLVPTLDAGALLDAMADALEAAEHAGRDAA